MLAALLPAILMLIHAVAEMLLPKDAAAMHGQLSGQSPDRHAAGRAVRHRGPGDGPWRRYRKLRDALGKSLKPIASIIMIIAGGGAFQQMLTSAKVGDAIVHLTQQFAFPPLILGWLIAMLLSVSTGSATVGIVGAAGLLAPLAGPTPA